MKKILLANPPHTAIGSRIPREQLPPLGLLGVGGPLIDAGFDVAPAATAPAEMITNLDDYRVGWELIDQRDYKHQVLASTKVPPSCVLLWVKAIMRILLGRDRHIRHLMRWDTRMGRRVWIHEIIEFIFRKPIRSSTRTLRSFWGSSLAANEESMVKRKRPVMPIKLKKYEAPHHLY